MPTLTSSEWEIFLGKFPGVHLLQTNAWGELKSEFGWEVEHVIAKNGDASVSGAQVLFRRLPLGLCVGYIAKGPPGLQTLPMDWSVYQNLWTEIDLVCKQRGAIFLIMEPDIWHSLQSSESRNNIEDKLIPPGFYPGIHEIQPARTLLVDVSGDDDQILARMKQKTRYNIRLAIKRGVKVSPSADIEMFHKLMVLTGHRDTFGVHSLAYYRRAYELFHPRDECELFVAEYQETQLAALMVFAHGKRAWYFYGASANEYRDLMPTYLLQWEAIRWARTRGCKTYDLWGVPDYGEETLEANFTSLTHGLWGVYRFKRGFGGQLHRAQGPWDRIYKPGIYKLYRLWMSRRSKDDLPQVS